MLEATALLFVAYTGYGRIATLGEEVREPKEQFHWPFAELWESLATLRVCGLGPDKVSAINDLGLGVGLNRPLQLEVLVQSLSSLG